MGLVPSQDQTVSAMSPPSQMENDPYKLSLDLEKLDQMKCALRQQTAWILKSASVISEVCHLYLSFETALPQKIFIFNLDYDSVFLKLQNLTIHTRDIDRLLNSFQASSRIS